MSQLWCVSRQEGEGKQIACVKGIEGLYYNMDYDYIA